MHEAGQIKETARYVRLEPVYLCNKDQTLAVDFQSFIPPKIVFKHHGFRRYSHCEQTQVRSQLKMYDSVNNRHRACL